MWLLRMLDVAELVDLDRARALMEELGATRGAARFRGPEKGTAGVVLQNPPVAIDAGATQIEDLSLRTSLRLFDFGAVSVRFALDIAPGTSALDLAKIAARFETHAGVDSAAREVWHRMAAKLGGAIRGGHETDIMEDYLVFEITGVRGVSDAREALAKLEAWRLVLAEPEREVAPYVIENYLGRALQYYENDAALIGWNAALVLDPDGSRDELEVLEIATARLLELRYYDRLLARELARVYVPAAAARGSFALFRSPFVEVARRAGTLFVEMTELYDRVEGAITLVGDAYTARLYREAALRFRLEEISLGVKEKLGTLARVSEIFQAEIAHRRGVVLESIVVVLIVIEVVLGLVRR